MALRKDWPAIRADWLWRWLASGTVEAKPLLGTRVLIVARNSRPQVTWHRATLAKSVTQAKLEKHVTRYWLGTGMMLVPRWDPLEEHFDPVADDLTEIGKMDNDLLRTRGMYRLPNGNVVILIYQHVADALHFQRQQWHIRLDSYGNELRRLQEALEVIEEVALTLATTSSPPEEAPKELSAAEELLRERRQQIATITTRLADRERGAEILIDALQQEATAVHTGILGSLQSQTLKDLRNGRPTNTIGLQRYLAAKHRRLDEILVRPIVRPVRRAQLDLRAAIGSLAVGNGDRAARQLKQALRHLENARVALEQPTEISELHDKAA